LNKAFEIYSLGDSAATIDMGNVVSREFNDHAIAIKDWLLANSFPGLKDIVVAYSSVTLYFDPFLIVQTNKIKTTAYDWISRKLEQAYKESGSRRKDKSTGRTIRVPACYDDEFGFDFQAVCLHRDLGRDELINYHLSRTYRVYLIGFLPGFAYMGEVDPRIASPRKKKPAVVQQGSVGIAGIQTGIYPFESPGGWNIIGRTPLKLFDPNAEPAVLLQTGDSVEFFQITREQFDNWKS